MTEPYHPHAAQAPEPSAPPADPAEQETDGTATPAPAGPATEASCAHCRLRAWAERRPKSLIARLWRWHTTWCPGWKKYERQRVAAEASAAAPTAEDAESR